MMMVSAWGAWVTILGKLGSVATEGTRLFPHAVCHVFEQFGLMNERTT